MSDLGTAHTSDVFSDSIRFVHETVSGYIH